ncbi:MAG TPA: tetratricopeptide repeat protein [Vicinamibacteria bacterium]|nr:tetratricopeptide repeat protein [Vicinamibacteria bacterium]
MTRAGALLAVLAALTAGCARPQARAPLPPDTEEYVFPSSAPGELTPGETARLEKAWLAVRVGDAVRAERELRRLLRDRPGLVAAETALAYARLRGGRLDEARQLFEGVLVRREDYVPALVGASSTARRAGRGEEALELLRRAETAAPQDAAIRRRLAEVRLQLTEQRLAQGREALAAGDRVGAERIYRAALADAPEVAGLRLELADLLSGQGDRAGAIAVLEGDTSEDRQVLGRLAELQAAAQDLDRALATYRRILARDPRDEEALRRSAEVREQVELLRMPEEYRRIAGTPAITRADLAALLAVKVTALARVPPGTPPVAVDISGSWAREHILEALAYDAMTVYPNHTFQPGATVRRGDVARVVQRVLDLLGHPAGPAPALTDMSRGNLNYYPAARAVAAGLMDLTPAGAFEAWRPVSGAEATHILDALVRLVGP